MIKEVSHNNLRKYSVSQLKKRIKLLRRADKKEHERLKITRGDARYWLKIAEESGKTKAILIEKEVHLLLKEIKK